MAESFSSTSCIIFYGLQLASVRAKDLYNLTQVEFSKLLCMSVPQDCFILANSADPDEIHYATFHQGLHCLPKYLFRGFQYTKGLSCLKI